MMTAESLRCYSFALNDAGEIVGPVDQVSTQNEAAEALDGKVREYQAEHPRTAYRTAIDAVVRDPANHTLLEVYSGVARWTQPPIEINALDAPAEVERRARAHMRQQRVSFIDAVDAVLGEDESLRHAYAAS